MAIATSSAANKQRSRTTSPWWASLILGFGLLLILLAATALHSCSNANKSPVASSALVLSAVALRAWATLVSRGERRRVERTLLLTTLSIVVGVGLYYCQMVCCPPMGINLMQFA